MPFDGLKDKTDREDLLAYLKLATKPSDSARSQSVPAAPGSKAVISGPVGPGPCDIVWGWQKPFAGSDFAFGGNSGVFAESPDRIFIAQRGETRLPDPVPPGFTGLAGSIGINVLTATDRRGMHRSEGRHTSNLRRARLRAAAVRLAVEPERVLDVALDCGLNDVSNFNRAFRAEFGVN